MYNTQVIVSFGDKATRDIYDGRDTKAARKIPRDLWPRIQDKLDLMNAAVSLNDLKVPPSNRLEKLRGDLESFHSIRVNLQYRLIFRFAGQHCADVRCRDYH